MKCRKVLWSLISLNIIGVDIVCDCSGGEERRGERGWQSECDVGHRLLWGYCEVCGGPALLPTLGWSQPAPDWVVAAIGSSERQPAALRLRQSVMQLNYQHWDQLTAFLTNTYTAPLYCMARLESFLLLWIVLTCPHLFSLQKVSCRVVESSAGAITETGNGPGWQKVLS